MLTTMMLTQYSSSQADLGALLNRTYITALAEHKYRVLNRGKGIRYGL